MPVTIDAGFPGGNIVVEAVDGDEVRLHQDLRDTVHDWFYWYFRVRGAEGRTLHFRFTASRALGVRGPAVSRDAGRTWAWLGSAAVAENGFVCAFPPGVHETRFSFGMPYVAADWARFADSIGSHPAVSRPKLCVTPKGRAVEGLLLEPPGVTPVCRVAVTCRHHCCEMMADYALEGLVRWLLFDPAPEADRLRSHVGFFLVPLVDIDGVEDGDQGKGRRPRDHGRDYAGESLYASTAAIRERLPAWGGGRLRAALDLHCPHIAGQHNETIYLVGSPRAEIAQEQRRFSGILESVRQGPLPFAVHDFLPFGTDWNAAANFTAGQGFAGWAGDLPGVRIATGIEIPYANAGGVEVNPATARPFGADLGRALAAYLTGLSDPAAV